MHKLSGGERKRTMIAIELVTDPDIIFLDEPTSGLDTKTAFKIVKMLNDLTKKGKMVIITIHQPSVEIYRLFDKLLLMSNSKTVYFGQAQEFESILSEKGVTKREGISFPDFIAEMVVKEDVYDEVNPNSKIVNEMIYQNIEDNKRDVQKAEVKQNESYYNYTVSFGDIFILVGRKLKLNNRNKYALFKQIIMKCLTLLLLCGIFLKIFSASKSYLIGKYAKEYRNQENSDEIIKKLIYAVEYTISYASQILILVFLIFTILFNSISAFFDEQNVIKREIAVESYSTTSYYFAMIINQIILEMCCPFIVILIAFSLSKECITSLFVCFLFLTVFVMTPFGMALGSITSNKKLTLLLSTVIIIPALLPPIQYALWNDQLISSCDVNTGKYMKYLFYILPIFPTVHFYSIFNYLKILKYYQLLSQDPEFWLKCETEQLGLSRELITSYLNYMDIPWQIYHVVLLFFASFILFVLFGAYRQAGILMPKVRTRLEK